MSDYPRSMTAADFGLGPGESLSGWGPEQVYKRQRFEAGPGECDDGVALTEAIDAVLSEDDMFAGWAAWYASGDELW